MKQLQYSLYYLTFIFGIALPFSTKISNAALILIYLVVAVLYFINKTGRQKENVKWVKYSLFVLFTFCIISFFVSEDIAATWKMTGRRISFLLTPLIFLFLSKEDINGIKNYALKGLLTSSLLVSLVLLINNFVFYYATRPLFSIDNELLNFYHTGFHYTEIVDIHPSYLGMYYLLALSYLIFASPVKNKILNSLSFIIIAVSILFLASRIVIFLFCLLTLISLWKYLFSRFKSTFQSAFAFGICILLLVFGAITLFGKTYLFESITKEAVWELSYNAEETYNSKTLGDSRVARWDAALELIYEKPLLGYGVGTEKKILVEKYKEKGLFIAASNRYDAHNQFISYTIESGILGLFIFIFYIGSNLIFSFKSKDLIASFFFISLIFISLVENFFNNNAGITFIAFFGTVFLFSSQLFTNQKE